MERAYTRFTPSMASTIVLAFLHHAAAFVIVAVITVELALLKGELTLTSARSIVRMDAAYGIAAATVLVAGLLRVFYTEKGALYYSHSAPFIAKMILFAIVAALSVYPTIQFIRWRTTLKQGRVPVLSAETRRNVRLLLHLQATLLFAMMLSAVMMARGVGVFA